MKIIRVNVSDEEMKKERIAPGDLIIIDSKATVADGDLVAVNQSDCFKVRRSPIPPSTTLLGKVVEVCIRL